MGYRSVFLLTFELSHIDPPPCFLADPERAMDLAMDGEAFVSADRKAAPIAAAADLPDLYFFGLPGVGKSFCGEALQERWGQSTRAASSLFC